MKRYASRCVMGWRWRVTRATSRLVCGSGRWTAGTRRDRCRWRRSSVVQREEAVFPIGIELLARDPPLVHLVAVLPVARLGIEDAVLHRLVEGGDAGALVHLRELRPPLRLTHHVAVVERAHHAADPRPPWLVVELAVGQLRELLDVLPDLLV